MEMNRLPAPPLGPRGVRFPNRTTSLHKYAWGTKNAGRIPSVRRNEIAGAQDDSLPITSAFAKENRTERRSRISTPGIR